jgi:hypothetical protein
MRKARMSGSKGISGNWSIRRSRSIGAGSIERALLLQVCRDGEAWNLDDVEMVDFHPRKALFHTRHDVLADENCGPRWPRGAGVAPTWQPYLLAT